MTPEEKQKEIDRLYGEIGEYTNLLVQGDYRARKMIDEVAAIVKVKLGMPMPIYDKYLADEEKAETFRAKIRECEEKIKELKK